MKPNAVWREKDTRGEKRLGIVRSTFITDKDGRLRHALYDTRPRGHAARIPELVREL